MFCDKKRSNFVNNTSTPLNSCMVGRRADPAVSPRRLPSKLFLIVTGLGQEGESSLASLEVRTWPSYPVGRGCSISHSWRAGILRVHPYLHQQPTINNWLCVWKTNNFNSGKGYGKVVKFLFSLDSHMSTVQANEQVLTLVFTHSWYWSL